MKMKEINVKNYRSIRDITIDLTGNALLLVGQNNAGKSSLIGALRVFWGELELTPEDYHKDTRRIEITIEFTFSNSCFYDSRILDNAKIGIRKIPSAAPEFNLIKDETTFGGSTYNQYKEFRENAYSTSNNAEIEECKALWLLALKRRFNIADNTCKVTFIMDTDSKKAKYVNENGDEIKDFTELLPNIAFIDDDRNFDEEGEGKSKTLTNNIFGNHILLEKIDNCQTCLETNCESCMVGLRDLSIDDLTINDLEKLINNKVKTMSADISNEISAHFQRNFKDDYKIVLNSKSNVDKSFSLNTKIFLPALNKYVEISKVGAGVRSIYILSLLQAYLKLEQSNGHIFIIEEPEIYLHPSLQKLMASTLYEISQTNYVIITTHSPLILNRFEVENTRKVSLNNQYESEFTSTQLDELLQELGYSTSDILDSEYVIFVEGKDDKKWLEQIISKYYNVNLRKFFIVDTKSCNNIETYATLRFLNKTDLVGNFLIFRDSDTMDVATVQRKIVNAFRENVEPEIMDDIERKIHVTTYSSFENYFLDPEMLVNLRIVNSEDLYYEKIQNYLTRDRESINAYLIEKNDAARASSLMEVLYDARPIRDKMDDVKKYIRGHNLFGQFGGRLKNSTSAYIQSSSRETFREILEHLEQFDYIRSNQRV